MQGTWERQTGRFESGENYRVGKVVVASAGYDGMASKDEPNRYLARYALPGIKQPQERFATISEAKARVERGVAAWFEWTRAA
jgi:hypothetical protein